MCTECWEDWSRDGAVVRALTSHQCGPNLVPRVFVPLDQRSENESSGSNHFEITAFWWFCPSSFTARSASMAHARNGCSQSTRLPTAGQGERRLWERDWCGPGSFSRGAICGLSLLLVLALLRVFFSGFFQFHQDRGPAWKPAKADVASSLNIVVYLFINSTIVIYFRRLTEESFNLFVRWETKRLSDWLFLVKRL